MLRDLFIKTFDLFKFNTILIQPILLFILLIWAFVTPMEGSVGFSSAIIIHIILLCALTCALVAGWLNMFHECIKASSTKYPSDDERTAASFGLLKEFVPGVGVGFLNILTAFIIYLVLFYGVSKLIFITGSHYIGIPQSFTPDSLKHAFSDENNMLTFVNGLTASEKSQISKWNMLSTLAYGILAYLLMFWPVAIMAKQKNAFVSLFSSIKTVFKAPLTTLAIYLVFSVLFFVLTIFNAVVGNNFILSFIGLILFIYTLVYFILMLFLYYEENCENISDSGSNGLR